MSSFIANVLPSNIPQKTRKFRKLAVPRLVQSNRPKNVLDWFSKPDVGNELEYFLRGNTVKLERGRFFVDIFFVGLRKNDLDFFF